MGNSKVKKWFMLWMWRLQQISQVSNMLMLAITLTLTVSSKIEWRFNNPYTGTILTFLILAVILMSAGYIWDRRAMLWREQTSVLIDKNPYMKEKFAPKEIALYAMIWIPMMEKMGREDPVLAKNAQLLKDWLKREIKEDRLTTRDLEDIMEYMGKEKKGLFGLE